MKQYKYGTASVSNLCNCGELNSPYIIDPMVRETLDYRLFSPLGSIMVEVTYPLGEELE